MDDLEWSLYLKWYDNYAANLPIKGILYLTTPAKLSQERIGIRGRLGEESIPLDYLSALESQHESWIDQSPLPCLRISTEGDMDAVADTITTWIQNTILR